METEKTDTDNPTEASAFEKPVIVIGEDTPRPMNVKELLEHLLALTHVRPDILFLPVHMALDSEGNSFAPIMPWPRCFSLDPQGTPNPVLTLWPGSETNDGPEYTIKQIGDRVELPPLSIPVQEDADDVKVNDRRKFLRQFKNHKN